MRILVLQHLSVEHPGVFREFWTEAGHDWQVTELDAGEAIPNLDGFDVMTVMGGPMDVWQDDIYPWLSTEKAAIRRWVQDLGRPYLGLCLGHQLLAEALGGTVSRMEKPEVGVTKLSLTDAGCLDPIFHGFDRCIETLQWHSAEISALPQGAVVLATNEACAIQAMRWGPHAYGFQFHLEITADTFSEWASVAEYKASLERVVGIEEAAVLEGEIQRRLPAFRLAASQLDKNFWALARS